MRVVSIALLFGSLVTALPAFAQPDAGLPCKTVFVVGDESLSEAETTTLKETLTKHGFDNPSITKDRSKADLILSFVLNSGGTGKNAAGYFATQTAKLTVEAPNGALILERLGKPQSARGKVYQQTAISSASSAAMRQLFEDEIDDVISTARSSGKCGWREPCFASCFRPSASTTTQPTAIPTATTQPSAMPSATGSSSAASSSSGGPNNNPVIIHDDPIDWRIWAGGVFLIAIALVVARRFIGQGTPKRTTPTPPLPPKNSAPSPPPPWVDIDIRYNTNGDIEVSARDEKNEVARPKRLGWDKVRLKQFQTQWERNQDKPSDEARALYADLFHNDVQEMVSRAKGRADGQRTIPTVRLVIDSRLQSIPWEAVCAGNTNEELGVDTKLRIVRGINGDGVRPSRAVEGPLRLLVISTDAMPNRVDLLKNALYDEVEVRHIELLPPITGEQASSRHLLEALRKGMAMNPHVVHFAGHGDVDNNEMPVLILQDDEPMPIARFSAALRTNQTTPSLGLVFLEACKGSKTGAFGSGAQILGDGGIDAIIAYTGPVFTDEARDGAHSFYKALVAKTTPMKGDVARSMVACRHQLHQLGAHSASPVVCLRGHDPIVFTFSDENSALQTAPKE